MSEHLPPMPLLMPRTADDLRSYGQSCYEAGAAAERTKNALRVTDMSYAGWDAATIAEAIRKG